MAFSLFLAPDVLAANTAHARHVPNLAPLYAEIVPLLRSGGNAIYIVPPDTIGEDQTAQPQWWRNCTLSRMVSTRGVEQVGAIAKAIARLNVPIGMARSSELCIGLTTGTYLKNNPSIDMRPTPDLNPENILRASGLRPIEIWLKFESHVSIGYPASNIILSGHPMSAEISPIVGLRDLQPGETAILRYDHKVGVILVARLNVAQWVEMADYLGRKPMSAAKFRKPAAPKPLRATH